jgi:chromate transporter
MIMETTWTDVFLYFLKLGLQAWGGGQVVIGEMQRQTVAMGWLTEAQFLEAYAIGQMTPGPGTTYVVPIGYQAAGIAGALGAAVGFFLPTVSIGFALILIWHRIRESRWPAAIRDALMPVGRGLVLASVYTVGRSALGDFLTAGIACASLLVFWRTPLPTPVVILVAGGLGAIYLQR